MELMTLDLQNKINFSGVAKDKDVEQLALKTFPVLVNTLTSSAVHTCNGTTVKIAEKDLKNIFNHTYDRIKAARGKI